MKEYWLSKYHIQDISTLEFAPEEYSRFKYWSKWIAEKYGVELANIFTTKVTTIYKQSVPTMLAFSSPRVWLPTASDALMKVLISRVNKNFELIHGISPMREWIIKKEKSHIGDYSSMWKEWRDSMLTSDCFDMNPAMIQDSDIVISVDDIKITWSHEQRIREVLQRYNIQNDVFYLTYAELSDPNADPSIEWFLNNYSVKNLDDVQELIQNNDFILNTRVMKLILKAPLQSFEKFIKLQEPTLQKEFLEWAISNKYDKEWIFAHTIQYLQSIVKS